MTYTVKWSHEFKRNVKRAVKRGLDPSEMKKLITLLRVDTHPPLRAIASQLGDTRTRPYPRIGVEEAVEECVSKLCGLLDLNIRMDRGKTAKPSIAAKHGRTEIEHGTFKPERGKSGVSQRWKLSP